MEIVRLADGLSKSLRLSTTSILRDDIKNDRHGYNVFNQYRFRTITSLFARRQMITTMCIDNFKVEVFGSNAGVPGDYNNDGSGRGRLRPVA